MRMNKIAYVEDIDLKLTRAEIRVEKQCSDFRGGKDTDRLGG